MTIPGQAPGGAVRVGDLERRLHAFVIDRRLGWPVAAGAGLVAWSGGLGPWASAGVAVAVLALVSLGFAVLLGVRGTSPGKAALGLRVVDAVTGTPIGVGRALVRQLLLGLSLLPLGLGTATLAWTAAEDRTRERRGWHDHRTGSVVVDARRVVVDPEPVEERPRDIVNLTAMRLVPAGVPEPTAPPVPEPAPPAALPASAPGSGPGPSTRIPDADAATREPLHQPRPRRTWRVTVDSGESVLVTGVVLVGRNPEPRAGEQVAHLVPLTSSDMSISKTHVQFHVAPDGALVVTDRGSTNGSVLVRQGMSRELSPGRPATLLDGDRVGVGDREILVVREAG